MAHVTLELWINSMCRFYVQFCQFEWLENVKQSKGSLMRKVNSLLVLLAFKQLQMRQFRAEVVDQGRFIADVGAELGSYLSLPIRSCILVLPNLALSITKHQ
jgi:hypothetical protein